MTCTDDTKQEVLYLASLASGEEAGRNSYTTTVMKELAMEFGWPSYVVTVPQPVDYLINDCIEFGYVKRMSPSRFALTTEGLQRLRFLAHRFLDEDVRRLVEKRLDKVEDRVA
jgi:hypothetical protein